MRSKYIIITVACVVSWSCAYGQTDQQKALAEELMNVMNVKETIDQSMAMVKQMIPSQMQMAQQGAGQKEISPQASEQAMQTMDIIAQEFSYDKIKDDYIRLYSEVFSEDEMKGIIAFYKSPAGQAFLKKQPELMKKSMELSQKMMMRIMPKLQELRQKSMLTPQPKPPSASPEQPTAPSAE